MGELIALADLRRARGARMANEAGWERVEYFFDLSCPFSYLAAERVERSFADVVWRPASASALNAGIPSDALTIAAMRHTAERRAAGLRMPLQWPDRFPAEVPAAMRAAAYASEQGQGAAFALAAGRLAFCGGFDLDDPEILVEAAAAAGVGLEECLQAAGDTARDAAIEANGLWLLAAGAERLPVLRHREALVQGAAQVVQAAAAGRARMLAHGV